MNWEAIGAIGELLGALAVVVSLLYLAVQIRQNSRIVKGTSVQAITQFALVRTLHALKPRKRFSDCSIALLIFDTVIKDLPMPETLAFED